MPKWIAGVSPARGWAWVTLGVFGIITILGNATEAIIADQGSLILGPIAAGVVNSVPAIALLMTTHLAAVSVFTHGDDARTPFRVFLAIILGMLAVLALYMSWGALYDMAVHVGGMSHQRAVGFPFVVDLVTVIALLLSLRKPSTSVEAIEAVDEVAAKTARPASRGPRRTARTEDREAVLAMLEVGDKSLAEISAATGVPKSTIARWAKPQVEVAA